MPCGRELAQHAIQVPLQVRAQVQLRFLDQQHEALEAGGEYALHGIHEQHAAVRGRPVMIRERRTRTSGDVGSARAGRGRDEGADTEVRRQEEHRRRAGTVQVERVGWTRVEEDRRPALELRLEMDAAAGGIA